MRFIERDTDVVFHAPSMSALSLQEGVVVPDEKAVKSSFTVDKKKCVGI